MNIRIEKLKLGSLAKFTNKDMHTENKYVYKYCT